MASYGVYRHSTQRSIIALRTLTAVVLFERSCIFVLKDTDIDWTRMTKICDCFGSIGVFVPHIRVADAEYDRHPAFLGLVTLAEEIAPLLTSKIMRIQAIEFVPLFEDGSFPLRQVQLCQAELDKVQALCEFGGLLAACGAHDFTLSLQNQLVRSVEARKSFPFFWNRACYEDVLLKVGDHTLKDEAWFSSIFWRVTAGYARAMVLGTTRLMMVCRVSLTVLSYLNADTCVDDVSPYAEIEQIVWCDEYLSSFVFVRGTPPIFYRKVEPATLALPENIQASISDCVLLTKTLDVNFHAFRAHLASLLRGFHRCTVLNQLDATKTSDSPLRATMSILSTRLLNNNPLNVSFKSLLASSLSEEALRATLDEMVEDCSHFEYDPQTFTLRSVQQCLLRFVVSPDGGDDIDDVFCITSVAVARTLLQRMSFTLELSHFRFDFDKYEKDWQQAELFLDGLTRLLTTHGATLAHCRDPLRSFIPDSILYGPLCDPVCVRAVELSSQVNLEAYAGQEKMPLQLFVGCFGMGRAGIDATVTDSLKELVNSPPLMVLGFCNLQHFAPLGTRQIWLDQLQQSLPESGKEYCLLSYRSHGALTLYVFAQSALLPRVQRLKSTSVGDHSVITRFTIASSTVAIICSDIPESDSPIAPYSTCFAATAMDEDIPDNIIWLGRHSFSRSSPRNHPLHKFSESSRPSIGVGANANAATERIFHYSAHAAITFDNAWVTQRNELVRAMLWQGSLLIFEASQQLTNTTICKLKKSFGPLALTVIVEHKRQRRDEEVQEFMKQFGQIICSTRLGSVSLYSFADVEGFQAAVSSENVSPNDIAVKLPSGEVCPGCSSVFCGVTVRRDSDVVFVSPLNKPPAASPRPPANSLPTSPVAVQAPSEVQTPQVTPSKSRFGFSFRSTPAATSTPAPTPGPAPPTVPLIERGLSFMSACIEQVESRGLDEEGLYRISGVVSQVATLVDAVLMESKYEVLTGGEWATHTICGAVKRYLTMLNPPLVAPSLLAGKQINADVVRAVVSGLPTVARQQLALLVAHLRRIVALSSKNKMTPKNLATVFGPTLCARTDMSIMGSALRFVELLLVDETVCVADEADV